MRAITVAAGTANSARLDEVPEPDAADGALLVRALALGICGTDREIIAAQHGSAPQGQERLILGHESLGVVEEAPADCGFSAGDHVVGIVRRPDPVPCGCCASGNWDMCRNGQYTERGIKGRHGFGSERFRLEPDFAVRVDKGLGLLAVLMEPASIVAKAWNQIERIGQRVPCAPARTVLVTGAGPVGFLAALMGKQRGLEVHIFDRAEKGHKPELAHALGAHYKFGDIADVLESFQPDILIECTAAAPVIAGALGRMAPNGTLCLTGVTAAGKSTEVDLGFVNRNVVLNNQVVFGSVNANRAHYEAAAKALASADRGWLERLISRRVPLARWQEALDNQPGDVKVIIEFPS